MMDNERKECWKVGKPHGELCGARKKVLPKDVGRRTFWKVQKQKKLTKDESIRHSDTRIGNRTLQEMREAIRYWAKIGVGSEATRADGPCASKRFVESHCRRQYPPTQRYQSRLIIWGRRCVNRHVHNMLFDVNEGDLKESTDLQMQVAEWQTPNNSGMQLGPKKHLNTIWERK